MEQQTPELSAEQFDALQDRAGFKLTGPDSERLRLLFGGYLERLAVLHSVDLDDEEVAGVFPP